MGLPVGSAVGELVGKLVGLLVGDPVGTPVGLLVGSPVGTAVGDTVGATVGSHLLSLVGAAVVGLTVVGTALGARVVGAGDAGAKVATGLAVLHLYCAVTVRLSTTALSVSMPSLVSTRNSNLSWLLGNKLAGMVSSTTCFLSNCSEP